MNPQDQLKQALKIKRRWATDALNDAKYNQKQAERDKTMGNFILARMHQQEANVARYWWVRRIKELKAMERAK